MVLVDNRIVPVCRASMVLSLKQVEFTLRRAKDSLSNPLETEMLIDSAIGKITDMEGAFNDARPGQD